MIKLTQTCQSINQQLEIYYTEEVIEKNVNVIKQLQSADTMNTGHSDEWMPIIPFKTELLPVQPFKADHLPELVYEYVKQHAERLDDAPVEFAAIAVLVSAAAMIGNSVRIQPKEHDTSWTVPSPLWTIAVALPSNMKTPSLKAGVSLIQHAQGAIIEKQNLSLQLNHKLETISAKPKIEQLERKALESAELGDTSSALQLLGEARSIEKNLQPVCERNVIITDFTKAAVAQRLLGNPNGLLVFRDEINGLFSAFNDSGGDELRSFLLECYDASGSYSIDRAKFGTIKLVNMNMSILGGIQPSLLRPMLSERSSGQKNDGTFERFSLAVMPDLTGVYTDIAPDHELIAKMKQIFEKLATLAYLESSIVLKFNPETQKIWTDWAQKLKARSVRVSEQEQSILSKQASLCARLTLVLHVLNAAIENEDDDMPFSPSPTVPEQTLLMAIKLIQLFESHSRRIQAYFQTEQLTSGATLLLDKISAFDQPFSLRDLTRKAWKGLSTGESCKKAIDELVSRNYLKQVELNSDNGRAVIRYAINPGINQT